MWSPLPLPPSRVPSIEKRHISQHKERQHTHIRSSIEATTTNKRQRQQATTTKEERKITEKSTQSLNFAARCCCFFFFISFCILCLVLSLSQHRHGWSFNSFVHSCICANARSLARIRLARCLKCCHCARVCEWVKNTWIFYNNFFLRHIAWLFVCLLCRCRSRRRRRSSSSSSQSVWLFS